MTQFYKLTTGTIDQVIAANLPKSSAKLWLWICRLDPFGDRQVRITWEIAKEAIGISKTTFYRALGQLTDAGLLVSERVFGFWISPKNGNPVPEMEIESQKWDSTIYTDLQTFSYSPEGRNKEKGKIPDPEINTNGRGNGIKPETTEKPITAEVRQNSTAKPTSQGEEKCSAARRTKKRTEKNCTEKYRFDWLPEGPWNIDGKLDPNFRDWLAKKWLSQYGGELYDKQADVLAHFKKDPANLPIRWEQYHNEFAHRVENTKIRLDNGFQIPEVQQNNLIIHQRALKAVLAPEMNPVAMVATEEVPVLPPATEKIAEVTRGLESVEPVTPLSPGKNSDCEPSPWEIDTPSDNSPALENSANTENKTPSKNCQEAESTLIDNSPEYTILSDGTRLRVFHRPQEREPVAPEQAHQLRQMVQGFLKGFSGKREVCPKPKTELEELNEMLLEPGLREEAINRARRSPDYKYCPDTDQIIHSEEF